MLFIDKLLNVLPFRTAALVNPFLYRLIVLDFDLWTRTPEALQQAHLSHLECLLRSSRHRRFNIKRVSKMHIVKKLLYALRFGSYSDEMAPHVITAVRVVLISSFSDVAVRSISSYLASSLCQAEEVPLSQHRPRRRATLDPNRSSDSTLARSKTESSEIPLQVFEMLSDLVLERPSYLSKFAAVVNIKWILLFFHPRAESRAAVLALEILARLLIKPGRYAERLNAAGGL